MKIRCENSYSDGYESTLEYDLTDIPEGIAENLEPEYLQKYQETGDIECLWDYLQPFTGDGHGADNDLGWFYGITITEADDPALVGRSWYNCGN